MSHPTYDPGYAQPPADRTVKVPHLVFGLLFLGIAGIWALGTTGMISGERLTVLAPVVLIAAGLIGLVASLAGNRNRNRRTDRSVQPEIDGPPHEGDTEEIR
jgi:hypothetical protein